MNRSTVETPAHDQSFQQEETLRQDGTALERSREVSRKSLQPPSQIPGLTIQRCLGKGAYGSVWAAREENTGKLVAVKFYTHRRGLDWSLLNREVEKLAVLYTSRHIVGLLEVGWSGDPPYYVMEYLENGSLDTHLQGGRLTPAETVRIAKTILLALVHAHGCGILHCDLKPANVLLDSNFEPRLCDFGQSRLSGEQNPALGTLFYMAPEQANLHAVPDAHWDVYALGALMYHLLCGAPPFRNATNEELLNAADNLEQRLAIYGRIVRTSPRPHEHRKLRGVDKRLAEIVERCLNIDPQKRFPNAQAVLNALETREQQRARRPLIALGVVGPALLLAALFPIGRNAMQSAVGAAQTNLTKRALESDAVAAKILSRSVEREIEDRKAELLDIAADPVLREAILAEKDQPYEERLRLNSFLKDQKQTVDSRRQEQGRELDTSWFVTDAIGKQIWREPLNEQTIDKNWAHRDYFHGLNREFPPGKAPEGIQPISKPRVSIAFQSAATHQFMVAIAVPVWDEAGENVIGLLSRTTHLGQLLSEYKRSIGTQETADVNRIIALVDRRDWKLLDHPWMTPENIRALAPRDFSLLTLQAMSPDQRDPLRPLVEQGSIVKTDRIDDYRDPVGQINENYRPEWLAAFSPVGHTSFTAIVQERKDAALRPVRQMQANLVKYALMGLAAGCSMIGFLWFIVLRALNSRGYRNGNRIAAPVTSSPVGSSLDER